MKPIFTLSAFCLVFFISGLNAQTPSWLWAKGQNGSFGSKLAIDPAGNLFIANYFSTESLIVGADTIIGHANNGKTSFVAKYDSAGNFVWAKGSDGTGDQIVAALCTDLNGNIYIAGSFNGYTATFDSVTLTCQVANNFYPDIFIAKYNPSGHLLWAKSAGGTAADGATAIVADANGNVYVAGTLVSGSAAFGNINVVNVDSGLYSDYFISKYDSSGNVVWVKRSVGHSLGKQVNGLCMAPGGDVYMIGTFADSIAAFDNIVLHQLGTAGNAFVVKFKNNKLFMYRRF